MRHPQLKHESIMYDALVGGRKCNDLNKWNLTFLAFFLFSQTPVLLNYTAGIPACHWYGEHDDFNCIVIDLLGPSLKLLRQAVSDISLDITLNIACQLVCIPWCKTLISNILTDAIYNRLILWSIYIAEASSIETLNQTTSYFRQRFECLIQTALKLRPTMGSWCMKLQDLHVKRSLKSKILLPSN